jgi:hypothetical protein
VGGADGDADGVTVMDGDAECETRIASLRLTKLHSPSIKILN